LKGRADIASEAVGINPTCRALPSSDHVLDKLRREGTAADPD
jgi:hypothetical protein